MEPRRIKKKHTAGSKRLWKQPGGGSGAGLGLRTSKQARGAPSQGRRRDAGWPAGEAGGGGRRGRGALGGVQRLVAGGSCQRRRGGAGRPTGSSQPRLLGPSSGTGTGRVETLIGPEDP